MSKVQLDLSSLALDRSSSSSGTSRPSLPHKKRWFSRFVLPLGVLMGFASLLVAAAGTSFMSARPVTVVPVVVKRAELQQVGKTLFQAPGWIEPRPTAISVAAMTPGVIEELMVVGGQRVQKGEPIAQLVSIDAELVLEQAKNALAIREGELNRAKAELSAAVIRFNNPVHLRIQLADAKSTLTKSQTELAKLPYLIEAAESNVKYTQGSMAGKQSARGAIPDNSIAKAENDHAMATANLQELEQRKPSLEREVSALQEVVHALESQLELLVEETRQLQEAEAKVQSAQAYRSEAKLQVRQAELALERNTVRAPIDGRILRLVAAPGSRVMGLETTAGQSSSTVVEMYDPQKLQVRVDVRLEDVPLVIPGQRVDIETASSSEPIRGQVLQITSSANIQKNTLEVKVELFDPPSSVCPEMLVTAAFLASKSAASPNSASEAESIFVPGPFVQSTDSQSFVWIVDENSTARKRIVELGERAGDDLVAIKTGLRVTDKLIASGREGLRDGSRVLVTGDNQIIGMK
jgi:HlyD family secretion protein